MAFKRLLSHRLLLTSLAEPALRMASVAAALATGRDRDSLESRARGILLFGFAHAARVGRNVRFLGPARNFKMGRGVVLYGDTHLDGRGPNGSVTLAENVRIDVYCYLSGQGGMSIGRDTAVAAGTLVYSQSNHDWSQDGTPISHQATRYAPVTLGEGCWVGAGARILPGVVIGSGTHVGAGAVVTKSAPEHVVIAGVPARVIKSRK